MALKQKSARKTSVPSTGRKGAKTGKAKKQTKGIELMTPPFVASFPKLFEMEEDDNGVLKYTCCAIFNPSKFKEIAARTVGKADVAKTVALWERQWKDLVAAFKKIAVETYGCTDEGNKWMAEMRESEQRTGLRNGKTKGNKAGFGEGTWFFNMSSQNEDLEVIDRKGEIISKEEGNSKLVYSGCICRAKVVVKAYDSGGGVGITVYISNVQRLADGERLDNRTSAKDDFNDELDGKFLDDEDDDEDTDDSDLDSDDVGDDDDNDGDDEDFG